MKKVVSLILVALLIGITGVIFAHGGGSGDRLNNDVRNKTGFMDNQPGYIQELNLSEEQENQLEGIQEQYYEKREEIWDKLEEKQEELNELYFDAETSRDQLIEIQAQVEEIRDQLTDLRTQQKLDIRDILSAEQLEDFSQFGMGPGFGFGNMNRAGYHGHMRGHRGRGRHHDSGHGNGGPGGMGPNW